MIEIMDAPKVEIGGKEFPIVFGGYVLGKFFKKHKLDLNSFNEEIQKDYSLLYELAHDAIVFAHKGLGKEFNLTIEQFAFMVDSSENGLQTLMDAFANSQGVGEEIPEGEKKTEAQ